MVFHLYEPWKLAFADLALKFGKIIMLSASDDVLFDFDSDPLSKTGVVHCSTGSIAFARIKKKIIALIRLIKANLAGVFSLGGNRLTFKHIFIEVRAGSRHWLRDFLATVKIFSDKVFNSAELDCHPGD